MLPSIMNFSYLKRAVSIAAVLNDKGLDTQFKKRGDQLFGPCPVHGGDNPQAFVVSLSKNLWHCFTRCNTGGDVIDFVRRLDGKTYRQTAEYLAALTHTSPIPSTPLQRVSPEKSFQPFTLSLPLNPCIPWLQKKGIDQQTAKRFESGAYYGPGFLSGCIGVRLHDLRGQPIGYAGRRLDAHQAKLHGKWKFPPRLPKSDILYNFHRVTPYLKKTLVVVECPWAVMRLAQLNIPAVALLGIHLSTTQHNLLRTTRKVILMLDGDQAGKDATIRLRKTLEADSQVDHINLPPDLDPDDLNDNDLSAVANRFFP